MNIWHDMHPDLIRKEEYTVFTANSMSSTAVLAFDGSTGLLQLEHLSDPYVAAPNNTGYLPRTYTENGMPVETVILCSRPLPPMTLVRCRPVGLITLHLDGGEQRKMLLSAACADAFWSACLTVEEIPTAGLWCAICAMTSRLSANRRLPSPLTIWTRRKRIWRTASSSI